MPTSNTDSPSGDAHPVEAILKFPLPAHRRELTEALRGSDALAAIREFAKFLNERLVPLETPEEEYVFKEIKAEFEKTMKKWQIRV